MSVVNRMLEQLDARGAPRPEGAPPAAAAGSGSSRRLALIVIAGGLALAVLLFAELPGLGSPPLAQAAAEAPQPTADVAAPAAATAPAPAATTPQAVPPTAADTVMTAAAPVAVAARPAAVAALPPPPAETTSTGATAVAVAAPASALAQPPLPLPARIERRALPQTTAQRAAALLAQAHQLTQTGQREAARSALAQALEAEPRLTAARHLGAVLAFEAGDGEAAAELLRTGLRLEPAQPALAMLLAQVLVAQHRLDEALHALDAHGLHDADAEGLRGGILAQSGRHAEALRAYEAAARMQPGNPKWWFGLGVTLESMGQPGTARQAYQRALAIGLPSDQLVQYAEQRLRSLH